MFRCMGVCVCVWFFFLPSDSKRCGERDRDVNTGALVYIGRLSFFLVWFGLACASPRMRKDKCTIFLKDISQRARSDLCHVCMCVFLLHHFDGMCCTIVSFLAVAKTYHPKNDINNTRSRERYIHSMLNVRHSACTSNKYNKHERHWKWQYTHIRKRKIQTRAKDDIKRTKKKWRDILMPRKHDYRHNSIYSNDFVNAHLRRTITRSKARKLKEEERVFFIIFVRWPYFLFFLFFDWHTLFSHY